MKEQGEVQVVWREERRSLTLEGEPVLEYALCWPQVEQAGPATPEPDELIEPFTLPPSEIRPFLDANTTPIGTRCQLILEMLAEK